jgi:hypothetical protein
MTMSSGRPGMASPALASRSRFLLRAPASAPSVETHHEGGSVRVVVVVWASSDPRKQLKNK